MANTQININNSNTNAVKDGTVDTTPDKRVRTFTSGTNTWTTVATVSINVNNSSANVLVMVNMGLDTSAAAVGSVMKWQLDGADLAIADTAGSRIRGHSSIYRSALPASGILYYYDTGVSAGAHTYTLLYQANTSVTVGINRDAGTESSTTNRTLLTAFALEL